MPWARLSLRRLDLAAITLFAAAITALSPAHAETDAAADGGAEAARRAKVAARVGETVVTVGDLEDRLAAVPPLQAETFGKTPEAAAKKFLESVVVRDLLLAEGAKQRGLAKEEPWQHELARARSSATLRHLNATVPTASQIPEAEVKRYYEENRSRFDSPERVNLWRILTKTRDEAVAVLARAKQEPTIENYNRLARENSIDKATNLRGGNLGFLAPDGTSNEAGLKVDPALVEAARAVKDGQFVPDPVPEAGGFAVVWRRGTVPATHRSLEDAEAQIRATLARSKVEAADKKLMADLRAKHLGEVHPDLLKIIELGAIDSGLTLPLKNIPRNDR